MSHHPTPPRPDDGAAFSVDLRDALDPLVMALDVGSTGSRGGLHDATGTPVRGYRHKIEHEFTAVGEPFVLPDFSQMLLIFLNWRQEGLGYEYHLIRLSFTAQGSNNLWITLWQAAPEPRFSIVRRFVWRGVRPRVFQSISTLSPLRARGHIIS